MRKKKRSGVLYDADGLPFSRWKPAEKFDHVFGERYPEWAGFAVREHEFDPDRGWRWDFAWPTVRVAVEIHGFGFGHQAQQQMAADHEKHNAGVLAGWRTLIFDSRMLGTRSGVESAADDTARAIESHQGPQDRF